MKGLEIEFVHQCCDKFIHQDVSATNGIWDLIATIEWLDFHGESAVHPWANLSKTLS